MEFVNELLSYWWVLVIFILAIIVIKLMGIRFIPNNKVGIVEKVIGKGNQNGSIIALNGETGFQAKLKRAGIHILPWPMYKLHKVELITIPQGQLAYIFARNGEPLGQGQIAGKIVECCNFEDVEMFLNNGGQKGPQRGILREGTYAINLAQFIIIASDKTYYMPLGISDEEDQIEKMNRLIQARDGFEPVVVSEGEDEIAIVTVQDGPSLSNDMLLAPHVDGHNSYQDIEAFLANGGYKGRQEDILLDGTYYINRLFATIEKMQKTEIPIGQVGVVNYFTGEAGEDLSGDSYSHGDLVGKGKKGIWADVLSPNKYPWNPYAGKIYMVPTINFVLNWSRKANTDFNYDEKLEEITLITADAFQPTLPLSVVIHINYKDAPRVIQRFGDIKTLVEQTVDPMVGAYFKNIGQTKTLLELIQQRGDIQKQAKEEMAVKFKEYDLNLEDVLIGTPQSQKDDKNNCVDQIYDQLQQRQLAKETAVTLESQKETQVKKKEFAQAEKAAEMQQQLTESEMQITITENKGMAEVKKAEQQAKKMEIDANAQATKMKIDANAQAEKTKIDAGADAAKVTIAAKAQADKINLEAEANANATRMQGTAKADAIARKGIAEAIGIQEKIRSMGSENYSATLIADALAKVLAQYGGNMVPNIVIGNGGENDNTSAITSILTLLGLKAISPELKEMIEKTASNEELTNEEVTAYAKKIHDEVLDQATQDSTENLMTTTETDESSDVESVSEDEDIDDIEG